MRSMTKYKFGDICRKLGTFSADDKSMVVSSWHKLYKF
jgi:hypothetical protein